MALTPADLDVSAPAVRVRRRRKGKGAAGGWKPLPGDAGPALATFIEAQAWGRFSRDALRQCWHRACDRLGVPRTRPYDLRHSFAAYVLEQTKDIRATQLLMSHADSRTTEKYAQRGIPDWLKQAMAKVSGLRQQIAPKAESD
jgi:integrase